MINKGYQRRHLRAPFRESIIYADGPYVLKASTLNISELGMLLGQIPSFPETDLVSLLIPLPQLPLLKNFSLLKLQTFSKELFPKHVIRAKAKMVRREQLSQNLENIFLSRFGLEFVKITPQDQKKIEQFVANFSGNLIYLQTLIDSFNTDDETKIKVRTLAKVLGYHDSEKISHLRSLVLQDYKSLQWL